MPALVTCPTCAREVLWSTDNEARPFCSERCKLIDLGAWAEESYRVAVKEEPDSGVGPGPGLD